MATGGVIDFIMDIIQDKLESPRIVNLKRKVESKKMEQEQPGTSKEENKKTGRG